MFLIKVKKIILFCTQVSLNRYISSCTNTVRVRFAPSPTGFLHLGGLRTAFFNYLFAHKNKGKFILRLEDTDQKRVKQGSYKNLNSMLKWVGLIPDESPEFGGPYQPYVQSQRLQLYEEYVNKLLKAGSAYRCFCSDTRLDILKKEAIKRHETRGYDNKCRHLSAQETEKFLADKIPFTIRFKIPEESLSFHDLIFGTFSHNVADNEGDFVIMKSDGYPTYHFACVVDDHLMEISHVMRGAEWLISTPKHIMLHRALGWDPPQFAHLPLLTNSDRSKLSKRQDSIGIEHFKNKGYYPSALLNFLASAGGGFGKQEGCCVQDLEELCSKFEIENVNKGSCIVDMRKLDLFNQDYIAKQLANDVSTQELIKELRLILKANYGQRYQDEEKRLPDSYMKTILHCYKDRITTLNNLVDPEMEYLWTATDPSDVHNQLITLRIPQDIINGFEHVFNCLSSAENFHQETVGVLLKELSSDLKLKYSVLLRALRIVLTGQKEGPPVSEIIFMLGKSRSLEKISSTIEFTKCKISKVCK